MIGKRLLQLIIHSFLCVLCLESVFSILSDYHIGTSDIVLAVSAFTIGILLAASVWLNWIQLRLQSWKLRLTETRARHFVLIPVSLFIVYFSGQLRFRYDGHLSLYSLAVNLPEWYVASSPENFEAGITGTAEGVCLFLIYVFVFIFLHTLQTLGLFSSDGFTRPHTSRLLLWAQLVLGVVMVLIVSYVWYRFYVLLEWFIPNAVDGDLLNGWNIGRHLFRFLSVSLLSLYALWVVVDAFQMHFATKTPRD